MGVPPLQWRLGEGGPAVLDCRWWLTGSEIIQLTMSGVRVLVDSTVVVALHVGSRFPFSQALIAGSVSNPTLLGPDGIVHLKKQRMIDLVSRLIVSILDNFLMAIGTMISNSLYYKIS